MMEWITRPWPWYFAGPLIALTMFVLLYFGKSFGFSSNLRTMCAMAGGDKFSDFFKFDWRSQSWNLVFLVGAVLGGILAATFMMDTQEVELAASTVQKLEAMGFEKPGSTYQPKEIYGVEALGSVGGLALLLSAGFLVGFGARYAGGCTSGHAISGLSDLQLPSLIAVVGFFIGGLTMVHLIFPFVF